MAQHPRLGRASPLYTIDGKRERKSSTRVVVRSMYTRALTLSPLHTINGERGRKVLGMTYRKREGKVLYMTFSPLYTT
jgi:hypothetical protein